MLKRYTFWLIAAILFQFLNALVHSLSFVVTLKPANDTERQIHQLITTYREDMGAGFHRTFFELFTALSTCYVAVSLLGGLTLGFLLIKHAEAELMRGVILINLVVFSAMLVIMIAFAFLPPVILCGLIAVNLLMAFILVPKRAQA